jgi:hypothetical protein
MKYRLDDDDEQTSTSGDISQRSGNQIHLLHANNNDGNQINATMNSNVTIVKNVEPWRISRFKEDQIIELELTEDIFMQGTVSLGEKFQLFLQNFSFTSFLLHFLKTGPFLTSIWSKLQTFTSNTLYVNIHLTGLISHIALYPLPLVHSILLRPDIPTTSDIPSFYQVLKILKQQIDAELPMTEDSLELIDVARTFLIDREFRLINARKIALEALKSANKSNNTSQSSSSQQSSTQMQTYDPFKRHDEKRKSSGNSIMNIFRRSSAAISTSSSSSSVATSNAASGSGSNNSNQGKSICHVLIIIIKQ